MFRIPGVLRIFPVSLSRKWAPAQLIPLLRPSYSCKSTAIPDLPGQKQSASEEITSLSSVDQVFSYYRSVPKQSRTSELCIEALNNLSWLYKSWYSGKVFLHPRPTGPAADDFIQHVHENPLLQDMMKIISSDCSRISDHDLGSCLYYAKVLKINIRETFAQEILEEILRRKETLTTSALSTLALVLRSEHLYGCLVATEFLPIVHSKIHALSPYSAENEIGLISSALRMLVFMRCVTQAMVHTYLTNISLILDQDPDLQIGTLVRVIRLLTELRDISFAVENPKGAQRFIIGKEVIRKCCRLLEPKVCQMNPHHLEALSKLLEFQEEPASFVRSALNRARELWLENYERVDLMSIVRPIPHDMEENAALLKYLDSFLEGCVDFNPITARIAYRSLKKLHFDSEVYDKYWSRVNEFLNKQESTDASSLYCIADVEGFYLWTEADRTKMILTHAQEYVNILFKIRLPYSHRAYEESTRDHILQLSQENKEGRVILLPRDYATALAFLLAINHDKIEIDMSFLQACRLEDFLLIQKGAEVGGLDFFIVAHVLNRLSENLFRPDLTPHECIGLMRLNVCFQRHIHVIPNPMFQACLENVVGSFLWKDSRTSKEMLSLMQATAFYFPEAFERVAELIVECEDEVSLQCTQMFLWASYSFGTENEHKDAIAAAGRITERYFDYIHPFRVIESALALCYHGALNENLIKRIFADEFIESLDTQIQDVMLKQPTILSGYRPPSRVRNVFMSLNRAVCLGVPEVNLPWFHRKHCDEMSLFPSEKDEDYILKHIALNGEVGTILESIVGAKKVVRNAVAPYHHHIDFLLHLDENGSPQDVTASSRPYKRVEATKLALIVHMPKDYTLNVRQLKGAHKLKRRHLEILGYIVIDIDPLEWKSLQGDVLLKKRDMQTRYIESCIFGEW